MLRNSSPWENHQLPLDGTVCHPNKLNASLSGTSPTRPVPSYMRNPETRWVC